MDLLYNVQLKIHCWIRFEIRVMTAFTTVSRVSATTRDYHLR